MADKMFENNQVSIIGEIVSDFQFSHEVYGEGFYMMEVSVRRLSDCMEYNLTCHMSGSLPQAGLQFLVQAVFSCI